MISSDDDASIQHIVHRKHRKYATNHDNFIQLDYLLQRVQRQTRPDVAESIVPSLDARPHDSHDIPSDDGTKFSDYIQVPEGDTQGFSSSQEVSDYLPQPYKGTMWDDIDNPDIDADADGEKPADSTSAA